jgi:ABC-type glycerol-3-phosphate transport system substrate-binding protein
MKGSVRELGAFIKRDWKAGEVDDFYKGPYEGMKIDSKQMAIPSTINNNIMYVNKNHLREAALTNPGDSLTRDQFLDYVQKVTKLTYDTPKAIEGLQFIHDLRWKHQVSPISNDQRGGLAAEDAFLQGKISIYMVASNNAGNIAAEAPQTGLDWDFMTLPKGPGGQGARVSMDGYVIDKQTKFGEQAWIVLSDLVSNEMAQPRAETRRLTPPRRSGHGAWEKGYAGTSARLSRSLADVARADPRAFWKDSDIVGGVMEKYVQATMNRNELGVAEAMRQAMSEVRGYYSSR